MTVCRGRPFTNHFGKEIDPLDPDFEVTSCPRIFAYVARPSHGLRRAANPNGCAGLTFCHIGSVRQAITLYGRAAQPRPGGL